MHSMEEGSAAPTPVRESSWRTSVLTHDDLEKTSNSTPLLRAASELAAGSLASLSSLMRPSESTLRFFTIIDDALVGTMVAVSWSYILVQQVDPRGVCPSVDGDDATTCRVLVAVLFINTVLGAFYLPFLSLAVMRLVNMMTRKLLVKQSAIMRDSAASELERSTSYKRRMTIAKRIQHLLVTAASYSWSVSASCMVYYILAQILAEASNGEITGPSRPGPGRGPGPFAPSPRDANQIPQDEDNFVTPHVHSGPYDSPDGNLEPLTHAPPDKTGSISTSCTPDNVASDLERVVPAVFAVSSVTSVLCVAVMLFSCRELKHPSPSAYRTEVLLLLSRFLYCAWATAIMAPFSLMLFPCYELSLGSDSQILFWAGVRGIFFFCGSYLLSRCLLRQKDDKVRS